MKTKNRKTVIRLYWAWNDDREERWLNQMAREGWRLTAPRGVFYRFEKGEPADIVYRLDFQILRRSDRKEYLELFRDAGWEHAGDFSNWHYFRIMAGGGSPPEIHTDPASRIAMFRRLLGLLVVVSVAVLIPLARNLGRDGLDGGFWIAVRVLQAAVVVFMVYAIHKILAKIARLRKSGDVKEKI
jgi:uncharacterized membrane protein